VLYSHKMSSEKTISEQLDEFNKLIIYLYNIYVLNDDNDHFKKILYRIKKNLEEVQSTFNLKELKLIFLKKYQYI